MTLFQKIGNIFRADFVKNSATLLSANVLSQAITLFFYPLLTRLYSPSDFGLFNLFLSIGGIITLFGTANYHYAIVLPPKEKKAIDCFHIGLFINIVIFIVCLIALFFTSSIASLFDTPILAKYLYLLPFFVFLSAFWNLLNYWFTRKKQFKNIGSYQVIQSVGTSSLKYGFGLLGYLGGGLIIGTVVGQLLAVCSSIALAWRKGVKKLFSVDKYGIKVVAKEYANFPKYSLPHSVVNTLGGSMPILLLTPFFLIGDIGYFGMALALAFRPINIISNSLNQVFYQTTAVRVNHDLEILPFFKRFISRTALILVPSFILLYFILPWLTAFLLGHGWSETGEYIRLMLPWLLMSAMVAPISYLADIFEKQQIGLLFEVASILMRLSGLLVGIYFKSFYLAIALYCVASTLIIALQLVWYWGIITSYENRIKS